MSESLDFGPVNDPSAYGYSPDINWGGMGSTLVDLAKVWGGVEVSNNRASTPTYQVAANGQMYREGVPVGGGSVGGISPLLLLILVGAAVFVLKN